MAKSGFYESRYCSGDTNYRRKKQWTQWWWGGRGEPVTFQSKKEWNLSWSLSPSEQRVWSAQVVIRMTPGPTRYPWHQSPLWTSPDGANGNHSPEYDQLWKGTDFKERRKRLDQTDTQTYMSLLVLSAVDPPVIHRMLGLWPNACRDHAWQGMKWWTELKVAFRAL